MKLMKWLFWGIGIVCAVVGIVAAVKPSKDTRPTDNIDGGVRKYNSGEDAPKTVESTEITEFHCTVSLYADPEPGELESGVYIFSAVVKEGMTGCSLKWHNRTGNGDDRTFEADPSFMTKLQEIVSTYDFARHNGYLYKISGLPDMYGASIDIVYASGESIYAYNNQDNFLSRSAIKEIFDLFTSFNEK